MVMVVIVVVWCVMKIAAQWILCRLENVMQSTWRNHTPEDIYSHTLIIIVNTVHNYFVPILIDLKPTFSHKFHQLPLQSILVILWIVLLHLWRWQWCRQRRATRPLCSIPWSLAKPFYHRCSFYSSLHFCNSKTFHREQCNVHSTLAPTFHSELLAVPLTAWRHSMTGMMRTSRMFAMMMIYSEREINKVTHRATLGHLTRPNWARKVRKLRRLPIHEKWVSDSKVQITTLLLSYEPRLSLPSYSHSPLKSSWT